MGFLSSGIIEALFCPAAYTETGVTFEEYLNLVYLVGCVQIAHRLKQ